MKIHVKHVLPPRLPRQLPSLVMVIILVALRAGPVPAAERPSEDGRSTGVFTLEATESGATNQPSRQRPRTVAAAREEKQNHLNVVRASWEPGGRPIDRQAADLDWRSAERYYGALFAAVEQHWCDLLGRMRITPGYGKIVLEFNLHSDGRISGMKVTDGQAEGILGLRCQRAVLDLAPFSPWPAQMRRALGTVENRVTISFFHHGETSNLSRPSLRRDGSHFTCVLSYPPPASPGLVQSSPAGFGDPYFAGPWPYGWPMGYDADYFQSPGRKIHGDGVWRGWPGKDLLPGKNSWCHPPTSFVRPR